MERQGSNAITKKSEKYDGSEIVNWNGREHAEALITPSKRFVSAENNQVRKRSLPLSPTQETRIAVKQKQVAKCLFMGGTSLSDQPGEDVKKSLFGAGKGASRCLFGSPSEEETRLISNVIEDKRQEEFEKFKDRYVIESVLDIKY